jgi:hypothetical protein
MRVIILIFLFILGCNAACGLPVGNPAEASLMTEGFFTSPPTSGFDPFYSWCKGWGLRMGYYGDFVYNRNLILQGDGFNHGKHIRRTHLVTNGGYLALNIGDLVDVFSTLGTTKLGLDTDETSFEKYANSFSSFNWRTTFSWSLGTRITLIKYNNFFIGLEGQYFQVKPKFDFFLNIFLYPQFQYINNHKSTYTEWQGALGCTYALCCSSNLTILPYAALKWAKVHVENGNLTFTELSNQTTVVLFDLKNGKQYGFAFGMTACFCNLLCISAEGRWGDEIALNLNTNWCF